MTASATGVADPSCTRRWMPSTTTTASSMTRPIATARPPIDIRLIDSPKRRITTNVMRTASGSVTRRDERQPPVAKEEQQDDDGEHAADQNRVAHVGDRGADELGKVVDLRDVKARGQAPAHSSSTASCDAGLDVEDVRADLLRDADARRVAARCPVMRPVRSGRSGKHLADVLARAARHRA